MEANDLRAGDRRVSRMQPEQEGQLHSSGRLGVAAGPANPARALLTLFVLSVVISIGIGGVLNSVFPISPRHVHALIRAFGVWGPVGLVGAIILLIVFIPVTTIPFEIAGGVGYGIVEGFAYVLLAHIIGATLAFMLARRFGRPVLNRVAPKRAVASVEAMSEQIDIRLLILMRLLPLFDFKLVSYAAGLSDMSPTEYVLGTVAGVTLPILGMVSVGAELTGHPLRAALIVGTFGLLAGAGAAYLFFGRRGHKPVATGDS
jgi:uncharacterized membrane protein YdjX (TVP38/TMEM64 family)